MNASALMMALSTSKGAWKKYKDFRDNKASDLYDALLKAVDSTDGTTSKAAKKAIAKVEDSTDTGVLTKEARQRVEKALKEVREGSKNYIQDALDAQESATTKAKKLGKRTQRKALAATEKAAGKAQKKVDKFNDKAKKKAEKLSGKQQKKTKRNWLIFAFVAAGLVVGVGYYMRHNAKQHQPADDLPPRVEDYRIPDTKNAGDRGQKTDGQANPGDQVKDKADNAKEEAKAKVEDVKDKAEDVKDKAKTKVEDAKHEAKQKAEDAGDATGGAKHRLIEDDDTPTDTPARD